MQRTHITTSNNAKLFLSHSVAPPPSQTPSTDTRALIHDTQHTSHKTPAVSTVYKKGKLTLATDSKCSWLFCKALALCNVFPMEVFFLRNTSPWLFSQSMTYCCENKMSCQSHRIRQGAVLNALHWLCGN